jgi:hypothetical protein
MYVIKSSSSYKIHFQGAEEQEMVAMRELRVENLKKRANDTGDVRYCICRRGISGFMLQCELCKDWFHGMYNTVLLNFFKPAGYVMHQQV